MKAPRRLSLLAAGIISAAMLMSSCGEGARQEEGKVVGMKAEFALEALQGGEGNAEPTGVLVVELDDGTEVEAEADKALFPGGVLTGGDRVRVEFLGPDASPAPWKVIEYLGSATP